MPNKYSHGLVYRHQYQGITNIDPPLSLKPPSSRNSRSHTRSTASSICSPSTYSAPSSVYSDYLRLEPDPEPEPSYHHKTPTHTRRPSFQPRPSHDPQFESTSSERSRPPSDRLRLEFPFDSRIENPPSPPPNSKPTLSERPHCELTPSHRPDSESSSSERLRLGTPVPLHSRNPRPSLHHKSSSIETQIYTPEHTTSSPPPEKCENPFSVETHEPYSSPPPTRERQYHSPGPPLQDHPSRLAGLESGHRTSSASTQERRHVPSMESRESPPPPISRGHRQERLSLETQRTYLPFPTRDRRRNSVQAIHALASPPLIQGCQATSPFGTQSSPLFPSARELQDYFFMKTHGSKSTPAQTGDLQDVSYMNARSTIPTSSQDSQVRPSLEMQRLQSPLQTQNHQRRPSLGTQHSASKRRLQTTQESVHCRRQSIDSQTTRGRQYSPSLGPRHLSWDQLVKEKQHGSRQSIDLKTTQERQPRPSLSSQQLSLEQLIHESEHILDPSIDSQVRSSQSSSSFTGKSNSRQTTLANAHRYTPKSTSLDHSPRSRRDRPSKLPDTFASQHRILLPFGQGAYDNVLVETHGLPPERPPSPPATPDSSKSFSLPPQAAESQRTRPPPIPQRSAKRSPSRQRSTLCSTNSSVVHLPAEAARPETSSAMDPPRISSKPTALPSPTFSISTRRSSINATMSPQSVSSSKFSNTMTSPQRVSFDQCRDRKYFEDADLEPLPSEIDFRVLPYEDPNIGPAIFRIKQLGLETPASPRYEDPNVGPGSFRATQLGHEKPVSYDRPISSRASSFDSAAPPPIGLNRRISHAITELYQPQMPKKESKMSLLSFLRSTPAPKAVPYSEATQGKPPVSVSVSRTTVPSIPMLFPGYKGQFPPSQKMQDKGLRSGLEPMMRHGVESRKSAPRSTAHTDAAEKRKSQFKGDEVDQSHGAGRLEKGRGGLRGY